MLRRISFVAVVALACLTAVQAGSAADLLRVEGSIVKWPPPSAGSTTVITYALLSGRYIVAGRARTLSPDNCGAMQPFSDIRTNSTDASAVSRKQALRSAFAAWEDVADIKFVEVSEPATAHIVVGATEMPAGRAFANLSLRGGVLPSPDRALGGANDGALAGAAGAPGDSAVALIDQAFVCLNPKAPWKIGFDGNLGIYDLRHTFMHEIGHAIGLDHPGRSGSVMGFRYDESVQRPQLSDVAAVQSLYGPPRKKQKM